MNKKKYVLGFALSPDKSKILLIKKNRPENQAGKLNGIGGKIETYDSTPKDAMVREFKEETGLDTICEQWNHYVTMSSNTFEVYVYWSILDNFYDFKNITDEEVQTVTLDALMRIKFFNCMQNLPWLIYMLFDEDLPTMHSEVKYDY